MEGFNLRLPSVKYINHHVEECEGGRTKTAERKDRRTILYADELHW